MSIAMEANKQLAPFNPVTNNGCGFIVLGCPRHLLNSRNENRVRLGFIISGRLFKVNFPSSGASALCKKPHRRAGRHPSSEDVTIYCTT
jgi:hypothetical protein